MRSATSCFNSTLYRKTMTRFWPLWALYGLIWLFALPLNLLNDYFDNIRWATVSIAQEQALRTARNIPAFLDFGVFLSALFGILCAMAVFGYLYTSRSACMMHALPLRREALFLTNYLAGLSFLLLPHLAVALITAAAELALLPTESWSTALPALAVWLLVQSGTALFFFSFAVFCAMFTGHLLALPAFYGILNFLIVTIYWLVSELMSQFFYGYVGTPSDCSSVVKYCTPAYALIEACQWTAVQPAQGGASAAAEQWRILSPLTPAAYAAAGIVFAVLALLVYRCRHAESAGDVVSIPLVRPIFKYGVSFCSGLCFGIFTAAFFGWMDTSLALSLCAVFWAIVGYFAAEMLLKKSFRVLRAWAGALVMAAVMAALCLACFLDVFGVEDRVPAVDDVASLSVYGNFNYPYDDGMTSWSAITDPDQILEFTDLHQAVLAEKDRTYEGSRYEAGDDYISLTLSYTLTNGSTLERRYTSVPVFADEAEQAGTVTWCAERLLRDRSLVEASYDFDSYEQGRLVEAWLSNAAYGEDGASADDLYVVGYAQELWDAVRRDFDEGTIGVRYLFDDKERLENTYVTDLCFSWELPSSPPGVTTTEQLIITLTPNASHTLDVLEESGVLENGYALRPHTISEDSVQQ